MGVREGLDPRFPHQLLADVRAMVEREELILQRRLLDVAAPESRVELTALFGAVLRGLPDWVAGLDRRALRAVADRALEIHGLARLHRFLAADEPGTDGVWALSVPVLGTLAASGAGSSALRPGMLLMLLAELASGRASGPADLAALAGPGRLGAALPGVPGWWEEAAPRARIALAVAAAAVGAEPWLGELLDPALGEDELVDLARFSIDPRFDRARARLAAVRGAALREIDPPELRGRVLRGWLAVVRASMRVPRALDAPVAARLQRAAALLVAQLPAAAPELRADLLGDVALGLTTAAPELYARVRLGLPADRPLPLPTDSPDWQVAMRYDDVLDPVAAAMVRIHLLTGGGAPGSSAATGVWFAQAARLAPDVPRPLRLHPGLSARSYLLLGADGSMVEALVGPTTDIIEILRVAHRLAGGRDDDVDDLSRSVDQDLLLHQDAVVLGAWRRRPDGGAGEWLAGIGLVRTDLGLFFLGTAAVGDAVIDVGAAFGDFAARRAPVVGTALVVSEDQESLLPPEPLLFEQQAVVLPAAVLGAGRLRVPVIDPPRGALVQLPHVEVLRVAVVPPPAG
jgi:hypothetical protein